MTGLERLTLSTCVVDLVRGVVEREGELERLTGREAALLRYLASRQGGVVGREELLLEVWGYATSVVSRAVDKTVLRLRAKIERDRTAPDHLLTEYGVGFRLVVGRVVGQTPEVRPPRVLSAAGSFFGRESERALLQRALAAGERLISVVGISGIGKTRLVAEELGPSAVSVDALALDAAALDAAVRPLLDGERVCIESAEAHRAALVALIPQWLAAGRAAVILTSQAPLLLRSERVIRLGPLDPEAAEAMLLARTGRHRPGWGAEQPTSVAALCAAVEGWPLAIEHLALRARLLGPRALVAWMEDGQTLHALGPADLPDRHHSIHAALERTLGLLDPHTRQVAMQLSVFAGGATLEAAQVVVDAASLEGLMAALERLGDWGLVRVSEDAEEPRLELLPLLRAMLRERLPDDLRRAAQDRHLRAFSRYNGQDFERRLRGIGGPDLARRIQLESADLEAAMHHALAIGDAAAAALCGIALLDHCGRSSDTPRGLRVGAALAPCLDRLDPAQCLEVRLWQADMWARAGESARGRTEMVAIQGEAARLGLLRTEADACFGLALLATWSWDPDYQDLLERALVLRRQAGADTAPVLQELGWLHADAAHLPERAQRAAATLEAARRAALAEGNRLAEGMTLWGQAHLALLLSEPEQAWSLSADALPILVEMGRSVTDLREHQGRVALALGWHEEAHRLLLGALVGREREGGFRLARTLGYLATACLELGLLEAAGTYIDRAERLARQSGRAELVQVLYQRGRVDLSLGDEPAARRAWEEAEELVPPPFARILRLRDALAEALLVR